MIKKILFKAALASTVFLSAYASGAQKIGDQEIEKKIQSMSLGEKIDFLGGYNDFSIRPYPQYGIPEIRISDGPVGVRNFGPATAHPASINLAASWDRGLAYKTGKALGLEARTKNAHIVLGPGFNIYRLPITGRNFEYMGEDPYLAAQIAKDYIIGMQDQGVMADAKHYVANNQEYDRNNVSSNMDERTLHEIYLPAFKTAVQEAKVATIMTGYNLVNGIHLSEHDYLNNKVLKDDWGFEGFIVSDWASTYDGVAAANGGLDLEMPSGAHLSREVLIPAIKAGKVSVAVIDDKVRRILKTYDRFGLFTESDLTKDFVLDEKFVRDAVIEAARGGMVLLKNDNNTLPLTRKEIKTIAIIGPNGTPAVTGGGGSSGTRPLHPLSFVDAVQRVAGNTIKVNFEKGAFTGAPFPSGIYDNFPFYIYKDGKKVQGVNAEYYLGIKLEGDVIHNQFFEWLKLENEELWGFPNVPKTDFSVRFTSYFTPKVSGHYSIAGKGDDGFRILVDDTEIANLWRNQGPTNGKDDLFMNAQQEYKIVMEFYQAGGGALIYQGAKKVEMEVMPNEVIGLAVEAAKNKDLVIMSVGFGPGTESEAYDRTFEMPYEQSKLINAVADVNDNVIVVLNAGGNVEMGSWIDRVDAVLMAWYPGQEGNLAAAEILFGDTNPSGKLPATFEYALEDNPTYAHYFDHDKDMAVFYGEGIFMGYRYWDQADKKPRYPFGFGLSYTKFKYSKLKTNNKKYTIGDTVKVSIDITNTGDMDGAEVVQVYVGDKKSSLPRPQKELKGFEKVFLKKGETKTVEVELNKSAFAFYNPASHAWEVEPGKFDIYVGSSAMDIHQKKSITLK